MTNQLAQNLSENGMLPDSLIRMGIRGRLKERLMEADANDLEKSSRNLAKLLRHMRKAPVALLPEKANEQHYEVPVDFFTEILGRRAKYSCGYWPKGILNLNDAEDLALSTTCKHAGIEDGMSVLDLGCGWGSLSLWMAEHYPNSRILAVSNSWSQGEYIRRQATTFGFDNIEVLTADMNDFRPNRTFHRVTSVEMFEHMRNWPELFRRVSEWLTPDGGFFMHIFANRGCAYLFEDRSDNDWMSRHFFSGGMMPSLDLPLHFQDHLRLNQRWAWSGQHYEKTANAWLSNMDDNRDALWPIFEATYGRDFAGVWWMRWRMFFMACAELFGYDKGQQWLVGHYLFSKSVRA